MFIRRVRLAALSLVLLLATAALAQEVAQDVYPVLSTAHAAVREELFGDVDTSGIRKQIDKYIHQLRPATADEIKDALRDILDETEIRALVEHGEGELADVDILTATLETEGGMTREKARTIAANVKIAISKIRDEYGKSGKDAVSKISDAAMRVADLRVGRRLGVCSDHRRRFVHIHVTSTTVRLLAEPG
jgi:hypothetical protein